MNNSTKYSVLPLFAYARVHWRVSTGFGVTCVETRVAKGAHLLLCTTSYLLLTPPLPLHPLSNSTNPRDTSPLGWKPIPFPVNQNSRRHLSYEIITAAGSQQS